MDGFVVSFSDFPRKQRPKYDQGERVCSVVQGAIRAYPPLDMGRTCLYES